MSAETPKPQPGDNGWHKVDVAGYAYPMYPAADATVEVLERADDPSKSEVGEIRVAPKGHLLADSSPLGQQVFKWTVSGAGNGDMTWCWFRWDGPQMLSDETVTGWSVVGAVPDSPAAKAQQPARLSVRVPNEPHGIPLSIREQLAELLSSGNKRGAVGLLAAAMAISESEAIAYVESMSEYQTYLAEHGATEVDPTEADRMRAMGFDRQPEFKLTDDQRAEIGDVLEQRRKEFSWRGHDGERTLDAAALTGVVADIVFAAIRRDRERAGDS